MCRLTSPCSPGGDGLRPVLVAQVLPFPPTRFEQSETGDRLTSTWRSAQNLFKAAWPYHKKRRQFFFSRGYFLSRRALLFIKTFVQILSVTLMPSATIQ